MGNTKPIIVVAGEPYSIFLEIFFKAKKITKIRKNVILIVSKKLLEGQMKKLRYNYKINTLTLKDLNINKLSNNEINIIDVDFNFKKVFDKIGEKSNNYIDQCFKIALNLLKEHQCSGLINGPISKKSFLKEKFLGITEYLAKKTNRKNNVAMLIYNRKLSVSPLTTHIPLKNVYKNISKKKLINHVMLIDKFYKLKIKTKPKIGITGLNPHCESNYKSSEEEKIIKPAIKHLLKRGFKIDGPIPADTIFMQENSKKYDVIVGMYHDQVLTPIKTLFGFNAIKISHLIKKISSYYC